MLCKQPLNPISQNRYIYTWTLPSTIRWRELVCYRTYRPVKLYLNLWVNFERVDLEPSGLSLAQVGSRRSVLQADWRPTDVEAVSETGKASIGRQSEARQRGPFNRGPGRQEVDSDAISWLWDIAAGGGGWRGEVSGTHQTGRVTHSLLTKCFLFKTHSRQTTS